MRGLINLRTIQFIILQLFCLQELNFIQLIKCQSQLSQNADIFEKGPVDATVKKGEKRLVIPCQLKQSYLEKFTKLQWVKDGFGLGYDDRLPGKLLAIQFSIFLFLTLLLEIEKRRLSG